MPCGARRTSGRASGACSLTFRKRPTAIKAFGREHGTPDRSRAWSAVRAAWAAEISEVVISAGLYDNSGKSERERQFRNVRLEEVRRAMRCIREGHVVRLRDVDLEVATEADEPGDIFARGVAPQLEDRDLAQRPFRQAFLTEGAEPDRVSSWNACGAACDGRPEGLPVDLWESTTLPNADYDAGETAHRGISALVAILDRGPDDGDSSGVRRVAHELPSRCENDHSLRLTVSPGLMFPTRPFAVHELIAHALPRAARWEALPSSGVAHESNERPTPAGEQMAQPEQVGRPDARDAANDDLRSHVQRAALFGRGYLVDETLPRIVESELVDCGTTRASGDDAAKHWTTLKVLQVGKPRGGDTKRTFALAVVDVPPEYLKASAMDLPVRTLERYRGLTRLVNDALSGEHHPAFIVFPELSVPHEWFTRFAAKLAGRGVGMIAGVDFLARTQGDGERPGTVRNEVWISLPFEANDFPGSVIWRQPKLAPAPGEAKMLRASANLRLDVQPFPIATDHLVIENNGFRFSVLNCAELADVTHRARLRGHVDALPSRSTTRTSGASTRWSRRRHWTSMPSWSSATFGSTATPAFARRTPSAGVATSCRSRVERETSSCGAKLTSEPCVAISRSSALSRKTRIRGGSSPAPAGFGSRRRVACRRCVRGVWRNRTAQPPRGGCIRSESRMSSINDQRLAEVLAALGELLGAGPPVHLVVIGGSGLLALGVIDRATRDVDVVAIERDGELVGAEPLPAVVREAAAIVSRDFNLDPRWLNAGPSGLLDAAGLPDGFVDRLTERRYGPSLRVSFAGREDQIAFKLYAVVSRVEARDRADLNALCPTRDELVRATQWVRTHHAPGPVDDELAHVLADFGVEDVGRDA